MSSLINNILDKVLIRSFGYESIIDNPTLLSFDKRAGLSIIDS
jgi:hypothetical protein